MQQTTTTPPLLYHSIHKDREITDSATTFMMLITVIAMGILGAIAYRERGHFEEHPVISLALLPFAVLLALRLSACFASNLGHIVYRES
ncbi:MAG: hypothetical protein KDK62_06595 [Chlamydiia bacterium]|nr:hypothetical protein [Chlamydiia bacterium]